MKSCLDKLYNIIQEKNTKWMDILVILAYTIFHFVIFSKHEPFYDEAIAWNIARRATISDILFYIPHFEGHPPLWHLVLAVFAKSGMPYELSLSIVSYLFTVAAIVVLFKYSPFPKPVNWVLPFTYFFFFQYGITTRPYCMMILAFFLCAAFYGKRNCKPGRYVAALLFLCLTTAYGIIFAGGIAMVWTVEIFWESRKNFPGIIKDRRMWCLTGLLICAIGVLRLIIPIDTVNAVVKTGDGISSLCKQIFLLLFAVPSDCFYTNAISDYVELTSFLNGSLQLRLAILLSIMMWGMVVYYGRKYGTLWLWILPYTLFSIFAGMVYFSLHHLGIGFFAYFFWAWCTYGEAKNSPESLVEYKWMKRIRVGMISAALIIGVVWNAGACRLEWKNMQALGENQADFIKEHHLDDYKMMTGWHNFGAIGLNTRYHFITECVMPYFEHNEFYNYNGGIDEKGYLLNRKPTQEEMEQDLSEWREQGEPDVLYHLSAGEWEMVFPTEDYQKYRSVYVGNCDRIWKNTLLPFYRTFIRVREDLLEETGLTDGCVIVKN